MTEAIQLYVYDLSNGLARTLGPQLIGKPLEGIWHTSLVLFGLEVFYGQGISVVQPPGTTHHGTPHKQLDMGTTQLDKETFLSYIEGVREVYSADRYHLLDFNCNSFTNDVLGFLNGRGIPSDILNLPAEILATPFGQSMRPMIDSMFRGRAAPAAADAVRSTFANLPPAAAPQGQNPSGQSLASNLQICTSTSNFQSILQKSKAAAVMFTSKTCPPCEAIKPYFEELASTHGAGKKRIEFVLVEMGVGEGGQVAQSEGVRATPTFVFYSSGKRVGECKGADRGELKTQIQLLEMEAYPAHPHTKLSLPHLTALSRTLAPVTHTTFPALPALSTKLNSILTESALPTEYSTTLTKTVISYLAALPAPPNKPTSPLPPALVKSWSTATVRALDALPSKDWFPLIDLWRLALARDLGRLSSSADLTAFFPSFVARLTPAETLDGADKPLILTIVRLISNALPSASFASSLLAQPALEGVTRVVVRALLDADKGVRSAGAGLGWSVVGRVWAGRAEQVEVGGEEWEVEVASAVLEALGRESESVDVVHRLTATLGLLLFHSPHHEAIKGLLEVLEVVDVLKGKELLVEQLASVGKKEVEELLREVEQLCA